LFDASAECHCVYSMVDPVNLEQLVTEQLPLFERQWKSMVANVDVKQASGLSTLSESSICEPLKSYYNHGLMSRMEEELNIKRPFVLFGTKSERSRLTRARSRGITDSDDPIVGTAGINGKHPTHMVCQSVSPRGPICCARTYFFSSGHIPYPVAGGAGDLSRDKTDLSIMNKLYVEGIHAVLTAIQVYCKTHSIQKAETVMFDTLKRECERNKLPLGSLFASSRDYIEFRIGAVDMEGQEVSLTEGQRSPFLKIAQLSLFNIPSIEHKNETMGSVLFTETFMDSNLQVLNQDGTSSVDHQCLVLTEHLPRYISWAATENDIKMSKEVGSFIKMSGETHYGRVLINGESAHVFTSNQLAIPEEGKFYVYEKGIVFQHNRFGPIVLPKTHMEKLNFYDGDSPSVVALIIVTYKASFWQWLPLQNQSKDNILVFALTPRTKAYKAFFSEVLSVWQKTEDEPAMVMAEKLPEKYIHVHNELQNAYNMEHGSPSRHITPMVKAEAIIPKLKEFVSHHSVTSVGNSCVPHDDLSAVLNQPYDPGNFQDEIIITILSGIPGSHKENLCTTLTNLAKEQNRWITLKPALDFVDGFNTQSLQNSLTSIVTASRKRSGRASASSRKKQRVLIMTPSFTDVFDVVQAIACHPDPEIGRSLKIGAVSTCVDPLNSFMTHRYTFPKLLDQCAEGWVNNIICTSSTAIKNPDLDVLQQLLRSVNHDVALLLANNGEVTRSPDVDLILSESAFTESKMIRQRYLSCPGWSLGKFSSGTMTPPMTEICLKFAPPLEKNRLMNKLRTLRGALSKYPFQGNIYTVRGRVRFSDSGLKATEFNCVTLSGYLLMTPAEVHPVPPPSSAANGPVSPQDQSNLNFVVFVGVELQENKLKEWLRACVKPKPQKKQLRTRQIKLLM
uniref:Uncharacterized protein C20orf194-like n=1 Tax=Saccoglossus kowalevskii TaxID=10224 RepID=A0ABM0M9L4_SACKO